MLLWMPGSKQSSVCLGVEGGSRSMFYFDRLKEIMLLWQKLNVRESRHPTTTAYY